MLWIGLFALVTAVAAQSAPNDRPIPPWCRFPSGPYIPPKCPPNEYFEVCSYNCPSENCPSYPEEPCDPGDGCCKNACRCNSGYSRNKEGRCIPYYECSVPTNRCPRRCRPTCKVPNPENCRPNPECAYCGKGRVWDEDRRRCVRIDECPYGQGCNGDQNAHIREYPPACPSTCANPDEDPFCKRLGPEVGCVCNYGFILYSDEQGSTCIDPESCPCILIGTCSPADMCPCGNPCGENGTFSSCKYDCPSEFCPVDGGPRPLCFPRFPCPSGCTCKHKYVWKSREDRTCVLAEECPKVPCKPNEVWDPCPGPCFSDSCHQVGQKLPPWCRDRSDEECQPQCRCKEGYAREHENFTCVPVKKCPPLPQPIPSPL